jgi:hypothetical protein
MSMARTPNNIEILAAKSDITSQSEYLLSHNGALDVNATFPGLIGIQYDYISVAYPSDTTEVYTFKVGGSGGTTVAIVTIVYTDNTKVNLSTVTRS